MKSKEELQLHEQYAINNNANLRSVISIILTLIGVFGIFYKIYCDTECIDRFNISHPFVLAYVGTLGILYFIFVISLHQGVKQRCEQFIIFAIRAKYYPNLRNEVANDNSRGDRIFPKGYHPYGKKCFSIIQGLYKVICISCLILPAFIVLISISKFCHGCCFGFLLVLFYVFSFIRYFRQINKYKTYYKQYDYYKSLSQNC